MEGTARPDYKRCVAISTQAAISEMIAPGALVMLTPVVVGSLFGTQCLAGVLAGSLVSGVQLAVSMSNTGGAWDNAKKYIEVRAAQPGPAACQTPRTQIASGYDLPYCVEEPASRGLCASSGGEAPTKHFPGHRSFL